MKMNIYKKRYIGLVLFDANKIYQMQIPEKSSFISI